MLVYSAYTEPEDGCKRSAAAAASRTGTPEARPKPVSRLLGSAADAGGLVSCVQMGPWQGMSA
jgi:hypothetical protein